jgi:hypothetical protein
MRTLCTGPVNKRLTGVRRLDTATAPSEIGNIFG